MDTQMDWHVRFGADFDSDDERGRPGEEMPLGRSFLWNGASWRIPSLYFCDEGLVIDFLMQVPDDALRAWIDRWGLTPESEEEDYTPEQSAQIMFENPAVLFTPSVRLNGRKLLMECGHSLSWLSLFPDRCDRGWPLVRDHYQLDEAHSWAVYRYAFLYPAAGRPEVERLSVTLTPEKIELPGPRFTVSGPGDTVRFTDPAGVEHTLTVQSYTRETHEYAHEPWNAGWICPQNYMALGYQLSPPIGRDDFFLRDCMPGDMPRRAKPRTAGSTRCTVGVLSSVPESAQKNILGAASFVILASDDGVSYAASSFYFDPPKQVEWQAMFRVQKQKKITVKLL